MSRPARDVWQCRNIVFGPNLPSHNLLDPCLLVPLAIVLFLHSPLVQLVEDLKQELEDIIQTPRLCISNTTSWIGWVINCPMVGHQIQTHQRKDDVIGTKAKYPIILEILTQYQHEIRKH